MPPVLLLLALGAGAYLMTRKSSSAPKPLAANEAPVDARSLFASMLAPSVTAIETLRTAYGYFIAAANNQDRSSLAAARLAQYALVCVLKASMLSRGASPNADELAAIGTAPLEGGVGLMSYGDAGLDQQTAVATALADSPANTAGVLGQFIASFASVAQTKRTRAFLLALKAKQMALTNAVMFLDADKLPAVCYFAIANLPAANVPAASVNSILAY